MNSEIKIQIISSINLSIKQARKDTGKGLKSYDLSLRNFINELTDDDLDIRYTSKKSFEERISDLIIKLSDKNSPGYVNANNFLDKTSVDTLYYEYKEIYGLLIKLVYSGVDKNNILEFKDKISGFNYYKMFDYYQSNGAINAALPYWSKYSQKNIVNKVAEVKINDNILHLNEFEDIVYTEYIFERQKTSRNLVKNVKKNSRGICYFNCSNDIFLTEQGPYLEVHHIIPLNFSKKKSTNINLDCIENLVAICPTCHRRIHLEDVKSNIYMEYHKKLYNKVEFLARKVDINTFEEYLQIL